MRIATSSWTLHDTLGRVYYEHDEAGKGANRSDHDGPALSLLELPAFVAKDGIYVLEICHFHFPTTDHPFLDALKQALADAGVELANVLVDTGNLSNPDEQERRTDIEMTKRWQRVAAHLGAGGVRIDCGTEAATPAAKARSATALQELANHGAGLGLTTTTENWRTTSLQPQDLLEIMAQVEHPLNLCVDFGNAAKSADKYATLQALLPRGTSLHCKGDFSDSGLDLDEFQRCLGLVKASGFDGHIALIYDGFDDEWQKVLDLKSRVEDYFPEIALD